MRASSLINTILSIFLLSACTSTPLLRGSPISDMPRESRVLIVHAGQNQPDSGHPTLVRVQRDGLAVFLAWSEREFEVCAAPGETIPEGDSDFCGSVVSVDFKNQTATIRIYYLGGPIQRSEQVETQQPLSAALFTCFSVVSTSTPRSTLALASGGAITLTLVGEKEP